MTVTFTLTAQDDGYRVRDWFKGGQSTLNFVETATSVEEAEQILRFAYLGPDVDGVEVRWQISE
jgi:hypothetical protein